jgi:hypothetical protein
MLHPTPNPFLFQIGFAMDLYDEGTLRGVGRLMIWFNRAALRSE